MSRSPFGPRTFPRDPLDGPSGGRLPENFETALAPEASKTLGLGDPEQWGGNAQINIPAVNPGPGTYPGTQFVRAQAAHLYARGWDLACVWNAVYDPLAVHLVVPLLLVSWGAGKARSTGTVDLTSRIAPWLATDDGSGNVIGNTVQLQFPLPASSISVGCAVQATGLLGPGARPLQVNFFVSISPRSLS